MQNFKPKYKVQKSPALKNLEALNNGQVFVPKWVIVIGIVILVASAAVFAASIAISLTKKSNGLHKESCENRNCETKLGLKCINKVCLCPNNQFYLDKCYNLSTYQEPCHQKEHCKIEHNLICGIVSKCDCELANYWNSDSKKCAPRKTFSESCNGDECKKELNLFCNSGLCNCYNKQLKFWNGSACLNKKKHNQNCGLSNECLDSENTICLNSKCSCIETDYFKISQSKCTPRLNEYQTCSYDEMCLKPMFCSLTVGCRCQRYTFFQSSISACINQKLFNAKCSLNHECRQDLGLTCQNNICTCESSDYSWSSKSLKCKLTYAKSVCSVDSDCNESENLVCQLSGECDCPSTSSIKMCDCIRNQTNEQYWNTTSCVPSATFKSSCSTNYQCRTITENTVCSNSNKCECSDDALYFWNGLRCVPKRTYGQSCDSTNQCLDSEFTFCNDSYCLCDSTKYYSINKCIKKLDESQLCTSDESCSYPMTCVSSLCTCGGSEYYDNLSSTCIPKLIYDFTCSKDTECRSDLNLVCKNGKCACSSTDLTWSYISNNCLLTYNKGYCSVSTDCNVDSKLICQSHTIQNCSCPQLSLAWVCDCDRVTNNEKYWNGFACTEANFFGKNCTENFHCQTLTQNTVCIDNICRCADQISEYFDGSKCVPKKKYHEGCTESNQCLDSELTICNSTHCICNATKYYSNNKCQPRLKEMEACFFNEMCLEDMICNGTNCICFGAKYFDESSNMCIDQNLNNNYCEKDLQCRNDLGLICKESRCICGSSSHTWSNTQKKCLLTYAKKSCLTGDLCNPDENLKCINKVCNCPELSVDGMCDCNRTIDSEEFWDGSYCTAAKSYTDHCSNDFECQTMTQNTLCINGSCVCSNYSLEFWNGNRCQHKKGHLEYCSNNNECLDSESTKCLLNICSCPTGQYFHEGAKKCVSRLTESELCDNDTMCLEVMTCHSTFKNCTCIDDEYFSNATVECKPKNSINSRCDNDKQCLDRQGLTCKNNQCICNSGSHTWDSLTSECRLTYSTLACVTNYDCNTSENLVCSDYTERCNCPSNVTTKICDCIDYTDKYWNGSACGEAKTYGLPCDFRHECKYFTEKLTCRENICQCEENEMFNENDNICEVKCPIGTLIFENQCFFFSNVTEKQGGAKGFCKDLDIFGHNGWTIAYIPNASTNNFLKNYLASKGSTDIYWLDKRKEHDKNNFYDDEWEENSIIIDYSFCPSGKSGDNRLFYKVDCFYDDIKDDEYLFICRKTF